MKAFIAKHRGTALQFFRFAIVGVFGFIADNTLTIYVGIHVLGMGRIAAGFAAFPFVVVMTWFGNSFFTFREASRAKPVQQLIRFVMVCGVGLVLNRGTYSLLVSNVALVYEYPTFGLLAGTAAGMFFNFFVSKRLVFR